MPSSPLRISRRRLLMATGINGAAAVTAYDKGGNWAQFAPKVLYATLLGWPGSTATITTLNANRINLSTLSSVQLLGNIAGTYIDLPGRSQDGGGLHITLPSSSPYSAPAYVVKLTFSGTIPTLDAGGSGGIPTGWARVVSVSTGLALDSGGTVASGSVLKQWSYDGSFNLQLTDPCQESLADAGTGHRWAPMREEVWHLSEAVA